MMITTLVCMFLLAITSPSTQATTYQDEAINLKCIPMRSAEKRTFLACNNTFKSRHLASKYTMFTLSITNKSADTYKLDPLKNVTLMPPERIADRTCENRSWIPAAVVISTTTLLSAIFYVALAPAVAVAFTLGACAATINPHKIARNKTERITTAMLDDIHPTIINGYTTIQKVIVIRKGCNRGKIGTVNLINQTTKNSIEIKLPKI